MGLLLINFFLLPVHTQGCTTSLRRALQVLISLVTVPKVSVFLPVLHEQYLMESLGFFLFFFLIGDGKVLCYFPEIVVSRLS